MKYITKIKEYTVLMVKDLDTGDKLLLKVILLSLVAVCLFSVF